MDIIERLRGRGETLYMHEGVMLDAADEIERLRAKVEDLERQLQAEWDAQKEADERL